VYAPRAVLRLEKDGTETDGRTDRRTIILRLPLDAASLIMNLKTAVDVTLLAEHISPSANDLW